MYGYSAYGVGVVEVFWLCGFVVQGLVFRMSLNPKPETFGAGELGFFIRLARIEVQECLDFWGFRLCGLGLGSAKNANMGGSCGAVS